MSREPAGQNMLFERIYKLYYCVAQNWDFIWSGSTRSKILGGAKKSV